MKDKFCFSKTLTYLVLLVAVVVGAFYTMNYVNQKKVTTNSEAASSFYTASQQCSSLATGSNEVAYCIPGGSFNSIDIALKFVELKTGIKFSSKVRITSTKCSYIDVFLEGRCVVFTRTGGTANPPVVQNPPVVNPPVGGGLPTANCSTYGYQEVPSAAKSRIKDYCSNLYGGKYQIGAGNTCYSNTKTCATATNCETTDCLRCINQQVAVSNCPSRAISCLYDTTKNSIKSVVARLSTAINSANDSYKNSRIDAARKQLSNYYALRSTTGYVAGTQPNAGGCVLKGAKLQGTSCVDKPVSQDYCSCATWSRTQDVVNADCKSVIDWVNAGTYDKAP